MLVSLAVLTVALSIVGVVFTITTKATGQSAAYSETQNLVRQYLMQIEEDLKFCDPARGILVLVGRTQAAPLSEADREAGLFHRVLVGDPTRVPASYDPATSATLDGGLDPNNTDPNYRPQYSDPRADLMLFFTNRPTVSQAPPAMPPGAGWSTLDPNNPSEAAAAGAKFAPSMVMYGHAALGRPRWGNGRYYFPAENTLRHIEQTVAGPLNPALLSRVPLREWTAARRQTILAPYPNKTDKQLLGPGGSTYPLSVNEWQRVTRCEAQDPTTSIPISWDRSLPGDVAYLSYDCILGQFSPRTSAWLPTRTWGALQSPAQLSPYDLLAGDWTNLYGNVLSWLYYNGYTPATGPNTRYHHFATVLEDTPVELRSNLGIQRLPACAWFQVEFLMPEDPRNSLEFTDPDPAMNGQSSPSDMPRWTAVQPGKTYLFVPDTQENRDVVAGEIDTRAGLPPSLQGLPYDGSRLQTFARIDQYSNANEDTDGNGRPDNVIGARRIRMWPYAIRITVRVYDPRGRLDEPIVRTLVHRFD